jgi:hypothetical protein
LSAVRAVELPTTGRRLTLGCTAVKRAANELAEVLG